ncbi:MAG: 5'/3'-nucleotidase SurE [Bacteroidales bacterium]|jgi:5'-nucleotidase|nr:5'/3'-nucleotidase SurE [Bacteroidales bacterium]
MNIVIANDDGIFAQGLKELVSIAKKYGTITVVAPDRSRSGQSHAVTFTDIIRVVKVKEEEGVTSYQCSGTPADCVKIAIGEILKGQKVDLVLSGINHGSNAATNVIYSGTMAAAVEGALNGIDSIGFSIADHALKIDFNGGKGLKYVDEIIQKVITYREKLKNENLNGTPICWNVNFPNASDIKGIHVGRQSYNEVWHDIIVKRDDWFNLPYYWIAGELRDTDADQTTDLYALARNYVSIVPVRIDWTAHEQIESIKKVFEENL